MERHGHKVTAHFVRHGSGYACEACVVEPDEDEHEALKAVLRPRDLILRQDGRVH